MHCLINSSGFIAPESRTAHEYFIHAKTFQYPAHSQVNDFMSSLPKMGKSHIHRVWSMLGGPIPRRLVLDLVGDSKQGNDHLLNRGRDPIPAATHFVLR